MKLRLTPRAEKRLSKLPVKDIISIVKKLFEIAENPLVYVERLAGARLWKLRVGEYRVIMYINTGENEIVLLKIGHRKNVYKR